MPPGSARELASAQSTSQQGESQTDNGTTSLGALCRKANSLNHDSHSETRYNGKLRLPIAVDFPRTPTAVNSRQRRKKQ